MIVEEGPVLTKFVIGDLALRSALQLEKARKDRPFSDAPLRRLAEALRQTSFPASADTVAAMRPGYYESFSRLNLETKASSDAEEDIVQMVSWAVDGLTELADQHGRGDESEKLVNFCMHLHDEFVGRPAAEARFGRPETVAAPARFR